MLTSGEWCFSGSHTRPLRTPRPNPSPRTKLPAGRRPPRVQSLIQTRQLGIHEVAHVHTGIGHTPDPQGVGSSGGEGFVALPRSNGVRRWSSMNCRCLCGHNLQRTINFATDDALRGEVGERRDHRARPGHQQPAARRQRHRGDRVGGWTSVRTAGLHRAGLCFSEKTTSPSRAALSLKHSDLLFRPPWRHRRVVHRLHHGPFEPAPAGGA
jgi:hypothetical protein